MIKSCRVNGLDGARLSLILILRSKVWHFAPILTLIRFLFALQHVGFPKPQV